MALTYDEYWRKKALENQVGITATDAYRSALEYAGTKHDNAVITAENAYTAADKAATTALGQNQAIVSDAYRRDLATYGRKAEALAQSGLTGSGYSDNLARDAYATRQQGMSEAQLAYSKALTDAASAKELAIGAAKDKRIADEYSATAAYQTALAEVEKNAADTALTRAELVDIVNAADTSAPEEVERALLAGAITADEANTYRANWNAAIDPTKAFILADGTTMSKEEADKLIRTYETSPWATQEKLDSLKSEYSKEYEAANTVNTSAGFRISHGYRAYTGASITIKRGTGASTRNYFANVGEVVDDETMKSEADKVKDGEVFAYKGNAYIKSDDKIFALKPRGEDFLNAILGKGK